MATPPKRSKLQTMSEDFFVMAKSLDLHSGVGIKNDVISRYYQEIQPTNSIDESNKTITFKFSTANNLLIQPSHCMIKCTFRIVSSETGGDVPDSVEAIPVNNLSSSFWEGVDVKLNGFILESNDNLYPWRANIEKTCFYTSQQKQSALDMCDFMQQQCSYDFIKEAKVNFKNDITLPKIEDGAEEVNGEKTSQVLRKALKYLTYKTSDLQPENWYKRYVRWHNNSVTLYDTIHCDLFNQSRYLPPNSEIELTFHKNKNDALCINTQDPNPKVKVKLENFVFIAAMSEVQPEIVNGMMSTTVDNKKVFKIPLVRAALQYHSISVGNRDFSKTSSFLKEGNILPRRLINGFIFAKSHAGDFAKDPFHWHDIGAVSQHVKVGGQIKPFPMAICNDRETDTEVLDKRGDNISDFLLTLLATTGTLFNNTALGINTYNWSSGNALTGYDFTSGDCQDVFSFPDKKAIEFHCRVFAPDPLNNYSHILYAEYNSEYTIDEDRVVTIERNKLF